MKASASVTLDDEARALLHHGLLRTVARSLEAGNFSSFSQKTGVNIANDVKTLEKSMLSRKVSVFNCGKHT